MSFKKKVSGMINDPIVISILTFKTVLCTINCRVNYKNKNDLEKAKECDRMTHRYIFIAFFRAGMLGYGGGLSAIPVMHREVVTVYRWMEAEEFADIIALANTLPGPVNTKVSGYVGWRVAGFWGMMNAIVASVLPTALLMVLIMTTLHSFKDSAFVQGMTKGVLPVAGVMIGVLAWDFVRLSKKTMGWLITLLFLAVSIVVMEVLHIHPALLIAGFIGAAFVVPTKKKEKQKKVDRQ